MTQLLRALVRTRCARVGLCLSTLALAGISPAFVAAQETRDAAVSCENYHVRLSRDGMALPLELRDIEYMTFGQFIAFDYLLRYDADRWWSVEKIKQLRARSEDLWRRLATSFDVRIGLTPDLGYQMRLLSLDLSDELRAEIEAAAPTQPRSAKVWRDTRFDAFAKALKDLCIRLLLLPDPRLGEAGHSRLLAVLEDGMNPVVALSVLRSVPEVRRAGLAESEHRPGRFREFELDTIGDAAYVVATSKRSYDKSSVDQETLYFIVTDDSIRKVGEAEAKGISGFRQRLIPAEAWLN